MTQDKAQIEHYKQPPGDVWTYQRLAGTDYTVAIESIHCDLPLSMVYDRVELPEVN